MAQDFVSDNYSDVIGQEMCDSQTSSEKYELTSLVTSNLLRVERGEPCAVRASTIVVLYEWLIIIRANVILSFRTRLRSYLTSDLLNHKIN